MYVEESVGKSAHYLVHTIATTTRTPEHLDPKANRLYTRPAWFIRTSHRFFPCTFLLT